MTRPLDLPLHFMSHAQPARAAGDDDDAGAIQSGDKSFEADPCLQVARSEARESQHVRMDGSVGRAAEHSKADASGQMKLGWADGRAKLQRVRVSLDRFNADLAYAELAEAAALSDAVRHEAQHRAKRLGARWIEFYSAEGTLIGRAVKLELTAELSARVQRGATAVDGGEVL